MFHPTEDRLYTAPEANHGTHSDKADVFSLGVIVFKLLHDRDPFSHEELNDGRLEYDELYFDDRISENCRTFINKLLEFRVRSRKTVSDCLNDTWLNNMAPDLKCSPEMKKSYLDNMCNFKANNLIQKASLIYLVQKIPQEEMENLNIAYKEFGHKIHETAKIKNLTVSNLDFS